MNSKRTLSVSTMNTRSLVCCAMVAAMYTALCLATQPLSYGMIQVRIAEALTLMPIFSPVLIWGVVLGCGLSNLVGMMTGANMLGFIDIPVGTAATLVAAWMSYRLRGIRLGNMPLASALPPVLCNAVAIGFEWMWMEMGTFVPRVFLMNAVYVGAGQAVACFGMGIPLVYLLEKTGLAKRFLLTQDCASILHETPKEYNN